MWVHNEVVMLLHPYHVSYFSFNEERGVWVGNLLNEGARCSLEEEFDHHHVSKKKKVHKCALALTAHVCSMTVYILQP